MPISMRFRQNMKQRKITKKAMAFLMAVAMIITSFPALSTTVHASELPDKTQFAMKEDKICNGNGAAKRVSKAYLKKLISIDEKEFLIKRYLNVDTNEFDSCGKIDMTSGYWVTLLFYLYYSYSYPGLIMA